MGTHKTKVNGTNYTITAGRTKINSTNYTQMLGRTLIGGVMYMITFSNPSLLTLMQDATIARIAGRDAKSDAAVNLTFTAAGTYYIFAFCDGNLSITKAVVASNLTTITLTRLNGSIASGNRGHVRNNAGTIQFATSPTATTSHTVNGGTIAALQFPHYSTSVIDSILTGATFSKLAGRDKTSTGTVQTGLTTIAGKLVFAATNAYMGVSKWPTSGTSQTNVAGNNTSNQSLLRPVNAVVYISTTGSANTSVYGGTIVSAS